MDNPIQITYSGDRPTVSGRTLHEALEVKTAYKDWFPRMCTYGFAEGTDFSSILSESTGGRPSTDHQLTLDMAKELCMIQRTERGKQCRLYFLEVEKRWNSPEAIMARALQFAERQLAEVTSQNRQLMAENSRLSVDVAIMQPKSDYFDELVDRNLLTSFRDTAKELQIPPKKFTQWLLDHKYIYRDKKGKLVPYEKKNNGLFEVKECFNEKTQWSGCQTMVTPKGRETFRLLCVGQ